MIPNIASNRIRVTVWISLILLPIVAIAAQEKNSGIRRSAAGDSTASEQSRPVEDVLSFPHPVSPTAIVLNENRLIEMDHEEFGDWIAVMPGFYPLDLTALGAPVYGQILGLSSSNLQLFFRGRVLRDDLLGAPELNWIPPEALSRIVYEPFALSTKGVSIEADLRAMEAIPPTSRIATRDGYYGLGTVDFDFGQKIAPDWTLNGGGRIATYGGRFSNSEGYGLNLRSEVAFKASESLSGWGGVMQNKSNAEVPFTNVGYNRDRYDGDIAITWKSHYIGVYGVQLRAAYGGGDRDGWDEIGTVYRKYADWKNLGCSIDLNVALARWRLKGMDWSSTSLGSVAAALNWKGGDLFAADGYLGLGFSDDFAPERHLGLRIRRPLLHSFEFAAGATQHQRMPSRFETSADFAPMEHFLTYDAAFLQYPAADIHGNRNLRNEICTTVFAGPTLNASTMTLTLYGFWYRLEDPVHWRLEGDILRSWNAAPEETRGLLGWVSIHPKSWVETGLSGSFVQVDENDHQLFPEWIGHAWMEFSQPAFQNELMMRLRIWSDYWGSRKFPNVAGWWEMDDHITLNARISAELLGVHLYWGVNNIFREQHELFPGYPMMHKEEVWGVSWNFQN